MNFKKQKHRRGVLSGVETFGRFHTDKFWFGFVVSLLNSEYPQQDRADESKHGAYGEHIQSQGKVHAAPPLLVWPKSSRKRAGFEAPRASAKQNVHDLSCAPGMAAASG
jgi:hypothetical protein